MKKHILIIALLLSCVVSVAQVDKVKAKRLADEAVQLMDNGQPDRAILLLQQAEKLDPGTHVYRYEMAYAYGVKKDYANALEMMKQVVTFSDITDRVYQMLGNYYDITGDSVNALAAYRKGIEKFPNAGGLYLEQGNLFFVREQYELALTYYEQGIEMDPMHPSNYYRATLLFLASDERVWGMIYGELFMNLEPGSERSGEISKLLYDQYTSRIKQENDTAISVSFTKQQMVVSDDGRSKNKKVLLPFANMGYEMPMMLCALANMPLDYENICKMRAAYINMYEENLYKEYPNVLFDYQVTVKKAGHLDAYNHFMMRQGNFSKFEIWTETHAKEWDSFVTWCDKNKIILDSKNKFTRTKA